MSLLSISWSLLHQCLCDLQTFMLVMESRVVQSVSLMMTYVWPDHDHRGSNCGVFNIATNEIVWHKKPCFYINESQWFA
ncbi:hypothetical protein YC2023_074231 [Brassica napus]